MPRPTGGIPSRKKKKRCRLDGGKDEGGTLRLPNVDVVPAPEPAHEMREEMQAAEEGRAMRHPYRGMPLTRAPAARLRKYLWAKRFNSDEDLMRMGMRQKHWTSILQSAMLAAIWNGLITQSATYSMEIGK